MAAQPAATAAGNTVTRRVLGLLLDLTPRRINQLLDDRNADGSAIVVRVERGRYALAQSVQG